MESVELGWSPLVTVVYVIWCLATSRPLDYSLLIALIALNITCIVYARKLHGKQALRESPAAPAPVETKIQAAEPPHLEVKREAVETPRPEPKTEPTVPPRVEPKKAPPPPKVEAREDRQAQKQLEEAKGEAERWKQNTAALQAQLDEQARLAAERLDFALAITAVKERARAIRRQWPDTAFCQRPLRPQWWSPNAGQTSAAPWLGKAHEWHTLFGEARSRFFPAAPDDLYFRSLDLEEVIDFLDDILLSHETRPLHRETHVKPGDAPILTITSWGAPEGEIDKCGFWMRNSGELPASNIQLARAPVGSKVLSIYLPPSQTVAKDQQLFVIASLSGPQRATAYNLEDLLRKLPGNGINGAKPLGVPLRLIYDSKDGARYASRHELTMEDTGIKIAYVNTEAVAMPL